MNPMTKLYLLNMLILLIITGGGMVMFYLSRRMKRKIRHF